MARALTLLGKLLCWLGFHDFHVISRSFEFRHLAPSEARECMAQGRHEMGPRTAIQVDMPESSDSQ